MTRLLVLALLATITEPASAAELANVNVYFDCQGARKTDVALTVDGTQVLSLELQDRGIRPCKVSRKILLETGNHGFSVHSGRLNLSATQEISIKPGGNWILIYASLEIVNRQGETRRKFEIHVMDKQPHFR